MFMTSTKFFLPNLYYGHVHKHALNYNSQWARVEGPSSSCLPAQRTHLQPNRQPVAHWKNYMTDTQTDRQTDRQTVRQTYRQTDRHTHTQFFFLHRPMNKDRVVRLWKKQVMAYQYRSKYRVRVFMCICMCGRMIRSGVSTCAAVRVCACVARVFVLCVWTDISSSFFLAFLFIRVTFGGFFSFPTTRSFIPFL